MLFDFDYVTLSLLEGRVLPYKENGRYVNTWMAERASPVAYFLSLITDRVRFWVPIFEKLMFAYKLEYCRDLYTYRGGQSYFKK